MMASVMVGGRTLLRQSCQSARRLSTKPSSKIRGPLKLPASLPHTIWENIELRPPRENSVKIVARTKEMDGSLTIEGRSVDVSQSAKVIDTGKDACPLCSLGIEVDYTDVLILRQFIRKDGELLPRIQTGLCAKQHRKMDILVHKAQEAGLLDSLAPPLPDGKVHRPKKQSRYKFTGLNRYFTANY